MKDLEPQLHQLEFGVVYNITRANANDVVDTMKHCRAVLEHESENEKGTFYRFRMFGTLLEVHVSKEDQSTIKMSHQ